MALPFPDQDAVPFTPITAEFYNETIANIEALAAGTGLDDGAIPVAKLVADAIGYGPLVIGHTVLPSPSDTISVTGIPPKENLIILIHLLPTGGTTNATIRFNNDSGNNYANRVTTDGGAEVTSASTNGLVLADTGTAATDKFTTIKVVNVANREKLAFGKIVSGNNPGAANVPNRRVGAGKWVNTTVQINRIDVINAGTGDYATGSKVTVLGHD